MSTPPKSILSILIISVVALFVLGIFSMFIYGPSAKTTSNAGQLLRKKVATTIAPEQSFSLVAPASVEVPFNKAGGRMNIDFGLKVNENNPDFLVSGINLNWKNAPTIFSLGSASCGGTAHRSSWSFSRGLTKGSDWNYSAYDSNIPKNPITGTDGNVFEFTCPVLPGVSESNKSTLTFDVEVAGYSPSQKQVLSL